jgi:MATE family multidrug resistance protein
MALPRLHYAPTRADLRELLWLAGPIVLIQVGIMLMGVVDTIMVGHVSATALAAVALGNFYTFGLSVFGLGVLLALDPIVAQALGAADRLAVTRGLQRGLILSVVLTVPTSLVLLTVDPVLTLVRQPAEVIPYAAGYVYRVLPAVWPFYAFVVLRQTLQAHHHTRPIVLSILATNLINAVLNYALIFGRLGFPTMGVLGSAWATTISRWLMAVSLLALGWKHLSPYLRHLAPRVFDPKPIGRMLRLGTPIGAQMLLEWGAFGAIALLMGWLGIIQVAAHQVALNLASLTFMVPVGISSAASVLVGHAVGRGDADDVRRSSMAAILLGAAFMSLAAVAFISFPAFLARLYSESAEVLRLVVLLLPIAGVFQVFDGIQVVSLGVLRGLGDTRVPMIVSILGFWCLGIPVSLWLAFGRDLGAVGLWWGLVVGLAATAVFLIARIKHIEQYELARIMIDEHLGPHPGSEPAAGLAE